VTARRANPNARANTDFTCQTAYSDVVAPRDRAIQYSRRVLVKREVTAYWMPRLKRGMTTEEHSSAIPRRDSARVVHEHFRPREQRAQGKPGARRTHSLACKV
jgi:hypothetical protein